MGRLPFQHQQEEYQTQHSEYHKTKATTKTIFSLVLVNSTSEWGNVMKALQEVLIGWRDSCEGR